MLVKYITTIVSAIIFVVFISNFGYGMSVISGRVFFLCVLFIALGPLLLVSPENRKDDSLELIYVFISTVIVFSLGVDYFGITITQLF